MSIRGIKRGELRAHAISSGAGRPSDEALDELAGGFAVALRAGSVAASAVAGPLAASNGVSVGVLTAVIGVLVIWATLFVRIVLRQGLSTPIVLADATVVAVVLLTQGHIVPLRSVADGTTWMLMLASTAVFIPQLIFRPIVGVAGALLVTTAYIAGAPTPTNASFLVVQALVTSTLMTLLRRSGRSADRAIAHALRTRQAVRAQAARRADEREQYRRLHDTVLSTLTMVASGAFDRRSAILSGKASDDLRVLGSLGDMPAAEGKTPVSLAERLREVAAEAADLLTVDVSVAAPVLPAEVIERLAECVAEALRNVVRHAGVELATVRAANSGAGVVIEIVDQGRGFDLSRVPASRRGIRESILGRVEAVGGRAEVISRPGHGTRVIVRWPHG